MSVVKSKRNTSKFEAQHQLIILRREVTNLALNQYDSCSFCILYRQYPPLCRSLKWNITHYRSRGNAINYVRYKGMPIEEGAQSSAMRIWTRRSCIA